jgi:hypothetical protein
MQLVLTAREVQPRERAHASAVQRLRAARDRLATAERRLTDAVSPSAEWTATEVVSQLRAAVASREQWLYWLDHGESIRPVADGDWAE